MKIFLLCGKARQGKDTVAKIIKNYYETESQKTIITSITKYLKIYATEISNWDGSEETKPRKLLQYLGNEIIRKQINEDFLITRTVEDICFYKKYFDIIIVTGIRFPNEIKSIKSKFDNVFSIHLTGKENNLSLEEKMDITETALEKYFEYDFEIINNYDMDYLQKQIIKILRGIL